MVSAIGNKTNEIQVTNAAASSQYDQAVQAQQSESGVNLDEEAAKMVQYQQAYSACAQLIQTSNTMFNSLLSAIHG